MVSGAIRRLGKIDIIDILVASSRRTQQRPGLQFFRKTHPDEYIDYAKSQWFCHLHCIRAMLDHMIERQLGKSLLVFD